MREQNLSYTDFAQAFCYHIGSELLSAISANAAAAVVVAVAVTVAMIAAAEPDYEQDNNYPTAAVVTVTKIESTHSKYSP